VKLEIKPNNIQSFIPEVAGVYDEAADLDVGADLG